MTGDKVAKQLERDAVAYKAGFADGYRAAKAEQILCKDCKHQRKEYHKDSRRKDGGYFVYWCEKAEGYSPLGFDNQYCSEAERKEE